MRESLVCIVGSSFAVRFWQALLVIPSCWPLCCSRVGCIWSRREDERGDVFSSSFVAPFFWLYSVICSFRWQLSFLPCSQFLLASASSSLVLFLLFLLWSSFSPGTASLPLSVLVSSAQSPTMISLSGKCQSSQVWKIWHNVEPPLYCLQGCGWIWRHYHRPPVGPDVWVCVSLSKAFYDVNDLFFLISRWQPLYDALVAFLSMANMKMVYLSAPFSSFILSFSYFSLEIIVTNHVLTSPKL